MVITPDSRLSGSGLRPGWRHCVVFSGRKLKKLGGVCDPLPRTRTLFKTKIRNFPYPLYDLTKNMIPYLRPDPKMNTLFQTCLIINCLSDQC